MMRTGICTLALLLTGSAAYAQILSPTGNNPPTRPEDTEVYEPLPAVVHAGADFSTAPSDALVLFAGSNLDQWVSSRDQSPAQWTVTDGVMTVVKAAGDIQTRGSFSDYQLHIEYRIPADISGSGQARGNSGIFLASTGNRAGGYEIQVLDGYNNENTTYVNGMVGSIYKQAIPLVNPARKAGEWNIFDIIWTAPQFNDDGSLRSKARITAFLNGVLVQNNFALEGETAYIGRHEYTAHGPSPIRLQAHADPSEAISYRNIWLREL